MKVETKRKLQESLCETILILSHLSTAVTRRIEVHVLSFLAVQTNCLFSVVPIVVFNKLELRHVVKQLGQVTANLIHGNNLDLVWPKGLKTTL